MSTPKYPGYGKPCNRCGRCCQLWVCEIGTAFFGDHEAPCRALCVDEHGVYSCEFISHPERYIDLGDNVERKRIILSAAFRSLLGDGTCDVKIKSANREAAA